MSRDVRRLLGNAAPEVRTLPDVAAIEQRARGRRYRRIAGVAVSASLVAAAVVVAGAAWLGQDSANGPVAVQPVPGPTQTTSPGPRPSETAPSPVPRPTETAPSPASADGWQRVDDPAVFGGPGLQAAAGAAAVGEAVVVVGVDAANAADGQVGPGVWLSDGPDRWHRLDASAIDTGGAEFEDADLWMRDVAVGDDGTLVGVGFANLDPDEQPLVWRSDDGGQTWSLVPVEASGSAAMEAVTWTDHGFVAVGRAAGPAVWTSTNGAQWTQHSLPAEGQLVDVAWDAGHDRVVAALVIGDSSQLWTGQPDQPSEWSPAELPPEVEVASVAMSSSGGYAAGVTRPDGADYDGILVASSDGLSWQADPRSEALGGRGDQLVGTVFISSDGRAVVAGDDDRTGRIWISPNPDTHFESVAEPLFPAESRVSTVIEGTHGLIAVGAAGADDVMIWQEVNQ